MKKQVWKFETPVGQVTKHRAPWLYNRIVHVAVDWKTGVVCFWAEVKADWPDNEWWVKTFIVIGTGQDIPENCVYRGTAQNGPLVWHVYEENAA